VVGLTWLGWAGGCPAPSRLQGPEAIVLGQVSARIVWPGRSMGVQWLVASAGLVRRIGCTSWSSSGSVDDGLPVAREGFWRLCFRPGLVLGGGCGSDAVAGAADGCADVVGVGVVGDGAFDPGQEGVDLVADGGDE